MKKVLLAVVAAGLVLAASSPVETQGKIRIAIWEFENHAATSWWFHNQMGPAARNTIDTAFSENPLLSGKFSVIEREQLALVMKEQGLSQSGALDPQSAARVGKILGVRYIVTGGIDKFAINTTRGGFGPISGRQTTADATINMRFIDTTTAERVISISADAQVKKGGGAFGSANLSRDSEWGIASEVIAGAAKEVVTKLTSGTYLETISSAAGASGGVDMRIVQVDGTRAFINVGSSAGVKVGDKFAIFRLGPELIDPVTGAKLGAPEKQVGTGVVVEVAPGFATITVTGAAAARDSLRRQ
jgi:curli biogenesis system outer membrane secretion channel CsgG